MKAEEEGAFLLTDRSTYLTAKRDGVVDSLRVCVEGGRELLNPCSAMVGSAELCAKFEVKEEVESHAAAREFAKWVIGERAQEIIRGYGVEWEMEKSLFTTCGKEEFEKGDWLVGTC